MADTPRYGYNAAGQWTILQPGEAEWDPNPAVALENIYGNDTTSLLGQYYHAGGNYDNLGGLMSLGGAAPKDTSIRDIVTDYTRPYTEEELARNLAGYQDWQNMYINSSHWNPNDSNAYAIQNQTYNPVRNTVSNPERQRVWTSGIQNTSHPSEGVVGGEPIRNRSSTPIIINSGGIGGTVADNLGIVNNQSRSQTLVPASTNTGGEQRQNTESYYTNAAGRGGETRVPLSGGQTATPSSPYLSRLNDKMAYSGAPKYNDITSTGAVQSNTGLSEATKKPSLGTPTRSGNIDFSRALWR